MAIHQRLTAEFDLIYVHDEALISLPDDMVRQWIVKGRKIEDLDLTKCQEKPTIFKCRPLKTDSEHLADMVLSQASAACWQVFKNHVKAAENCNDPHGKPLLSWTDDRDPVLKDECRDVMPKDVVSDIAAVIIGKSEESSAVFTVPATWWGLRARSRMLHASTAGEEDASEKN
jgi:hypothetical protein